MKNSTEDRVLCSGKKLKEEGQAAVLKSSDEWSDDVLKVLKKFCERRKKGGKPEFVFEEFRYFCWKTGVNQPSCPNVWGALSSRAASLGLIRKTGKMIPACSRRTHAHPVNVWRVL